MPSDVLAPQIPIPQAPRMKEQPDQPTLPDTGPPTDYARTPGAAKGSGGAAYVADQILRGWMAGKYEREQRAMKKAREGISSAHEAVQITGDSYRALKNQGLSDDDPKVKQAKAALNSAYQSYLGLAEKYVGPDLEQGEGGAKKKPGVGARVKQAFTPQGPHLFLKSSVEALKMADPSTLYGEDVTHAQQRQLGDMKLQEAKAQQTYEANLRIPQSKRTPQQQQDIEAYEQAKYGPKSEKAKFEDSIISKMTQGQQLTPDQRGLAEKFGIIKPETLTPQLRETAGPHGTKRTEIMFFDDKGNLAKTQMLPGNAYVAPDHWESAQHAMEGEIAARTKWYMRAGMDKQTATQMAMQDTSRYAARGINMQAATPEGKMLNSALSQTLGEIKKEYRAQHPGAPAAEVDEYMRRYENFYSTDAGGNMNLDSAVMDPVSHTDPRWWDRWAHNKKAEPVWMGGIGKNQLRSVEDDLRRRLRARLEQASAGRGKKLAPEEIDKLLGNKLSDQVVKGDQGGQSGQGMQPPPGGGESAGGSQPTSALQPPPAAVKKEAYYITLNGQVYQRDLTADQAASLTEQDPTLRVSKVAAGAKGAHLP